MFRNHNLYYGEPEFRKHVISLKALAAIKAKREILLRARNIIRTLYIYCLDIYRQMNYYEKDNLQGDLSVDMMWYLIKPWIDDRPLLEMMAVHCWFSLISHLDINRICIEQLFNLNK